MSGSAQLAVRSGGGCGRAEARVARGVRARAAERAAAAAAAAGAAAGQGRRQRQPQAEQGEARKGGPGQAKPYFRRQPPRMEGLPATRARGCPRGGHVMSARHDSSRHRPPGGIPNLGHRGPQGPRGPRGPQRPQRPKRPRSPRASESHGPQSRTPQRRTALRSEGRRRALPLGRDIEGGVRALRMVFLVHQFTYIYIYIYI